MDPSERELDIAALYFTFAVDIHHYNILFIWPRRNLYERVSSQSLEELTWQYDIDIELNLANIFIYKSDLNLLFYKSRSYSFASCLV